MAKNQNLNAAVRADKDEFYLITEYEEIKIMYKYCKNEHLIELITTQVADFKTHLSIIDYNKAA